MTRRFFCALLSLFVLLGGAALGEISYEEQLVRLQVVSRSDDAEDQRIKLLVRDACLACAEEYMTNCDSPEAAYAALKTHLPNFRRAAAATALRNGFDGDVTVEAGVMSFPDRLYGEVLVPAGEYRALRVTLGAGEGHNWWCVLYPTLCGLDEAEYAAQGGQARVYSAIGLWLSRLFGGDAS